jgi:hypothetical protein
MLREIVLLQLKDLSELFKEGSEVLMQRETCLRVEDTCHKVQVLLDVILPVVQVLLVDLHLTKLPEVTFIPLQDRHQQP